MTLSASQFKVSGCGSQRAYTAANKCVAPRTCVVQHPNGSFVESLDDMHELRFGASISDAALSLLRNAALQGRRQRPEMIAVLALLERFGDAMAGLRPSLGERLSFPPEPLNRVAAYSQTPPLASIST